MNHVDILFANEEEILSLYKTSDLNAAIFKVQNHCEVSAITRGEKGSIVISGGEKIYIDAEPVAKLVDTTGAGDAYAAGFLFSVATGQSIGISGRIGSICAAEVVSHIGARPSVSLKELIGIKLS